MRTVWGQPNEHPPDFRNTSDYTTLHDPRPKSRSRNQPGLPAAIPAHLRIPQSPKPNLKYTGHKAHKLKQTISEPTAWKTVVRERAASNSLTAAPTPKRLPRYPPPTLKRRKRQKIQRPFRMLRRFPQQRNQP